MGRHGVLVTWKSLAGFLATMGVAASCTAPNATPTTPATASPRLVVELPLESNGTPNHLLVYAASDLVTSAIYEPDYQGGTDLKVVRGEEPNQLYVSWLGLECEARPVMYVDKDGDRLEVTLDHGLRPDGCTAMGIGFRVLLTLTGPVPGEIALQEIPGRSHQGE